MFLHETFAGTTEEERRAEVEDYWNRCDAIATFGEGAESFAGSSHGSMR